MCWLRRLLSTPNVCFIITAEDDGGDEQRAAVRLADTMSLSLSPFQLKVFALVRMVPMGYVTTYGEVAKATGSCARAVGQCMRKNPLEPGSGCSLEQLVP